MAWSLVLEKAGHSIIGCDIIDDYVKSLNDKTFKNIEPKVNDYLDRAKNFKATTDLKLAISSSDIVFVNVRTESDADGKYDHSQLDALIGSILENGIQPSPKHLVIATNVNPGYCDSLAKVLEPLNTELVLTLNMFSRVK